MSEQWNDICMMFSGGLDTTLAAAKLLDADPRCRLHLLTFCNGICMRVERSRSHVVELQEQYGTDRVLHRIEYVTEIFEEIRNPILEHIRRSGSTLAFDLCCRLSFETAAIIYCVNNDIHRLADGTNIDQGRLFLEKPAYLEMARAYFAEHGVEYFSPVYERIGGREGRVEQLRARGFSTGPKRLEKLNITSSLTHQPFCLFVFHTYFFTSFVTNLPVLRRGIAKLNMGLEEALDLRADRQEVGRAIIARRTQRAQDITADGLRLDERFCTTRLCGRDGVEIALPRGATIDLDALEAAWKVRPGFLRQGGYLRAKHGDLELEAYADGRIIVTGTRDRERATEVYRDQVVAAGVVGVAENPPAG